VGKETEGSITVNGSAAVAQWARRPLTHASGHWPNL
jgi:hypothetical protein